MSRNAAARVLVLLATAVALGAPRAHAQTATGAALTIDEVIDMVRVSSPQISPDGTRVLFSKSELDWDDNERNSRIWVVGADGQGARPFTGSTDDRAAQWSPDGRWVSFTRPAGEGDRRARQLFVLPVDGGEAVQLTRHATAVGNHRWADDGRSVFFVANDSLPDDREKERKNGDDAVFIDEGPSGQTQGSWNGVWMVEVETADAPRDATRLTPEGRRVGSFAPSPNGNFLAYSYRTENRRNASHLSEIWLLAIGSGEEERITENDAPEANLAWSPDGASLTFAAPRPGSVGAGPGQSLPVRHPDRQRPPADAGHRRGHPRVPLEPGRTVDRPGRARPHRRQPVPARRPLGRAGAAHRPAGRGLGPRPTTPATTWPPSSSPLPPNPATYGWRTWATARAHGLTEANPWIADKDLVEPEIIRWNSHDGLEIEGVLYAPADRSAPGATILEIHGGPAGVFTRGFDADAQLLLAQGYALLQPNVRGSSGYGDELLRGNMNDIGGGDYHDLMTGVDAIVERGVAHPDSLAVKGWSYGGILGRLDDHADRPLQGGQPGRDGRRLAERVRRGLQPRRGALVPWRRPLVEPGAMDRALGPTRIWTGSPRRPSSSTGPRTAPTPWNRR